MLATTARTTDLRSGLPGNGAQASVPYLDLGSIITFTDKDGDSVNLSGKFTVTITDDVPEADIDLKGGSVTVDETPGNQADDTTSNSVKALFAKLEKLQGHLSATIPTYRPTTMAALRATAQSPMRAFGFCRGRRPFRHRFGFSALSAPVHAER